MEILDQLQTTIIHVTLTLGLVVTLRSFYGFVLGSEYKLMDRAFASTFMVSLYLQLLFIAYLFTTTSFKYEESIRVTENAALTLFATILAQGGRLIILKASDSSVKFRFRSVFYGLSTGRLIYAFLLAYQ